MGCQRMIQQQSSSKTVVQQNGKEKNIKKIMNN